MKQKNIAIIPARSGSKRIPHKNIKSFLGKPIIAYSIEVALQSGLFDEVMVSTDDEKIADIARKYGAKVPFLRSLKTSDDYAVLSDVVLEVINNYDNKLNMHFDNICCILATAPFIEVSDLEMAIQKLQSTNVEAAFPVVEYDFPIQRALKVNHHKVEMFWPEFKNIRSQDLEPAFHDAGLFYWVKNSVFINQKTLWPKNTIGIKISRFKAQDIDTPEDWLLAELKYKLLKSETEI